MMLREIKCETCRWWRRHKSGDKERSRYGNCHYHAPRPVFGTAMEDQYCRHHESEAPAASSSPFASVAPNYSTDDTSINGVTFRVGDEVEWTHQAGFRSSGIIEYFGPARALIRKQGFDGEPRFWVPLERLRHA